MRGNVSAPFTTTSVPAARLDVMSFSDVEAYRDAIRYSSSHMAVQRAPRFTGWLAMLELNGVGLMRSEHNATMSVTAAARRTAFLFSTNPRGRGRVAGRDFPSGMLYRVDPGEPFHCASENYFAWATLGFEPERLTAAMEALGYQSLSRFGHGSLFDAAATPGWKRLLATHHQALRTGMTTPAALLTTASAASLADVLTQALMDCLGEGGLEPDRAAVRRHHAILKRMLNALENDALCEITVTALCQAANVTARTLREVCLHYMGMTPVQYLRFHRLLRVRGILRDADPARTVTAEVFARNGFWDIERAGKAYRAVFGLTAQDTLMTGEPGIIVEDTQDNLTRFRAAARGG